jgi:DMSO/TMAO reductase YedYZ molybdopterin-dependent catalytic subunit
MKRPALLLYAMLVCLLTCSTAWAMNHAPAPQPTLTITGKVTNPLKLTIADLARFQSVEIQLNEVDRDRQFHGIYLHQAVPLRTLLDMAEITTQDQPTKKGIELAVRVTGASGKQVVLSWGEIYYSTAAEYAIAFAAAPVKPVMTEARCLKCHGPEIYKSALDQYERPAQLPKLLIRGDFYTDRCVEGITRIEVIDPYPKLKSDRSVKLESTKVQVTGLVTKELTLSSLKDYPSMEMWKKVVGLHMGYHGLHLYKGVSLAKVLEAAGVGDELTKAVMISAPDGYRALFSFGELFQSFKGRRIMLAESVDGKLLEGQRGGKYRIIVPEELFDDRDVLAVDRIEIIDLKPKAKISIIGVGPGDTDRFAEQILR